MLWVSPTDCLVRKKCIRSSSDNWKKPCSHWPWSSWGTWTIIVSSSMNWQHLIEKLMMGGALLMSCIQTRKGQLGMWRLGATLATVTRCSGTWEEGTKQKPGLQPWSSSEQALALFRHLLGIMLFSMSLERREVKESWLILKYHLLYPQEWSVPMSRESRKGSRRSAWINKLWTSWLNSDTKKKFTGGGRRVRWPGEIKFMQGWG